MTPIRVRGKRKGSAAEKWHAGKQRKSVRTGSTTSSQRSSRAHSPSSSTQSSSRRPRRRHTPDLSRLEELPTEVLQAIFEYSANIDLPLASTRLASQLESRHLYFNLTSRILHPVFGGKKGTSAELTAVARLINSRFFTWTFFRTWLRGEFERLNLIREWRKESEFDYATLTPNQQARFTWYSLQRPRGLLPPKKLFRGPFTQDNIFFLRLLSSSFHHGNADPLYRERVKDGLNQAISEGAEDALSIFWALGIMPDIELLRHAVIDSGCNKHVVQEIIARSIQLKSNLVDVDFLDPALWAWADRARSEGNEKGRWLVTELKNAARHSGRKAKEIQKVKDRVPES